MTNLSKELCEICEIEREGKLIFKKRNWDKKTYISAGHGYKEFDFKSIPTVIVDIIPTKYYKETNGFVYPYSDIELIKQEYDMNGYDFVEFKQRTIDFMQAENFVKLMDLKVKGLTNSNMSLLGIINKEYWLTEREDYIRFLCRYYIPGLNKDCRKNLKQSIKEEEWKYEG